MRYFLALLLMVISCRAASPSFSSFNTNQFSTNNLFISIKDGAVITNLNVITDLFINSTNIVNLFAPSSVTNGAPQLWFDVASEATLTNTMESMVFFHDLNAGDDDSIALDYFVTTDQNFTNYAGLYAPFTSTSSSIQSYTIFGNAGPTEENRVQLSTDATSASIQMLFNGVLTDGFNVATPSGYTGGGTLFLSDDGTYKSSVTINPTDGYVPYRSNATTFADSPWYRINTNQLGFNGTSRFLFRSTAGFSENLGIGNNAMNTSVSGSANIGIGGSATDSVSSGSYNIGIGAGSNGSVTTTDANIAIGVNAQNQLVTGSQNIAIGLNSHQNDVAGTDNVAIGVSSMNTATNAVQNVAVGTASLSQMLNGSYNVALGYRAGYTNSTMQKSILIGTDANALSGSDTNTIVIGANTVGAGSNTTVIGNTNTVAAHIIASGYTGTGTSFLSDDGTYKLSGAVAGDSIWTNITGYVTLNGFQTTTNTLAFTSGAADNATNILLKVDSANYLSASGSLLAAFGNAGTNQLQVFPKGAVMIGQSALSTYGVSPDFGESLVAIRNLQNGDDDFNNLFLATVTSNLVSNYSYFDVQNYSFGGLYRFGYWDATPQQNLFTVSVGEDLTKVSLEVLDITRTRLEPSIASSGSAIAYLFDTSNTLTNGDKFVSIQNAGTEVLNISPNSTGAQIVWGPGSTNVLYRGTGTDVGNLVYTNGTTAGYGLTFLDPSNNSNAGRFQIVSGGTVRVTSTAASIQLDATGSANYTFDSTQFHPGTTGIILGAQTAQWEDLYLNNNIVWNGTTNSLFDTWGTATPEGAEAARPGSVFRNTAAAGVLSVKTDGTGTTGWQPVHVGNQAYLAANGTVSDATLVNLSLSVGVTSGKKYAFRCVLYCANSTAGDGVKIDFDGGSAAATNFRAHTKITDAALLTSTQTSALATDITAATITGDTEIEVNGSFEPSGTGTLIPRFAENSDGGGTLTVYRGSHLILTEIP